MKTISGIARDIRTAEAEGQRLLQERGSFNAVLAAKAQRNRYGDMALRLTRNDALQKYQSAFDQALRYAWLAAKAYDYETSLDPGDPASAATFLEEIIRTRQLGNWDGGEPRPGNGGPGRDPRPDEGQLRCPQGAARDQQPAARGRPDVAANRGVQDQRQHQERCELA